VNTDHHAIKDIFCAALEKATRPERTAYLDQACAGQPEIRAQIDELLRLHEDAGDFLEAPLLNPDVTLGESPVSEAPGTIIGRYKLLERIGEGGMAMVYMAEQARPIRRKVALKIIKLGMDTKQVIARFEAERQALALMDHPHIARVFDAGATETGRPYFVMELVTGVSITEYCDKNRLSTKERLALSLQVCNAVQHAHQKGIIHRDIKPSNVMVTMHDGKPVPKVIDFGIAKATNQRLTEKTLFTRYAHIIGTPAYMSPEQAEMSDVDIDTRSDIYSLGALLYELLAGTTPFSEQHLREAGYAEMQRVIREEEPTKPSTKLSTLGDRLTDVANRRSCSPDLLRRALRGDLDWIVMKSLEKDRTQRYGAAGELAADIQRHLSNEPVLAHAPSTLYRMQKFVRRHRIQVASALLFALVVGLVAGILSLWNRDRLQLAQTESIRHHSVLASARDSFARRDLLASLEDIESILDSPHVGAQAQLLYAGILVERHEPNEAAIPLNRLLNSQPEIAGAAHALLARIYWNQGQHSAEKLSQANTHREKAEELLPDTAEAYYLRALTAQTIAETTDYLNRALDLSPDHYEARYLRTNTYYCARQFSLAAEDALCLTVLRPQAAEGYLLRANALQESGHFEEAVACFAQAIARTPVEDDRLLDLYDRRRACYMQMGRYETALADARTCVSLSGGGKRHLIDVITALVSLGRHDEAQAVYRELGEFNHSDHLEFWAQCSAYVIETLDQGRALNLPETMTPAFLPMLEMEEIYHSLAEKGSRIITHGFGADWSPDGSKLVYTMGVHGVNGIAEYDLATGESKLLFVPGRNPRYSPDGQMIAFVRYLTVLPLDRLAMDRTLNQQPHEKNELWIMNKDGTAPHRFCRGQENYYWSPDSQRLFFRTYPNLQKNLFSILITDVNATPVRIDKPNTWHDLVLSPDCKIMSYIYSSTVRIVELSSQTQLAVLDCPLDIGNIGWAPQGPSFVTPRSEWLSCSGSGTALCVYDMQQDRVSQLLTAPDIQRACWSPDGQWLALSTGPPFYDIWVLDTQTLGSGQTLEDYSRDRIDFYTRRIETDPDQAANDLKRCRHYQHLNDLEHAQADYRQYQAGIGQDSSINLVFGVPENLGPGVNTSGFEDNPIPEPNGLSLFFARFGASDVAPRLAVRKTRTDPWQETSVSPVFEPSSIIPGVTTADGLELYFCAKGQYGGGCDLFVRRRATPADAWSEPINLGPVVNGPYREISPTITPDGLELYFSDYAGDQPPRPGGCGRMDIWVTRRMSRDAPWGEPENPGAPINTPSADGEPSLSADGLLLFFRSDRFGGCGENDLYVTRRATLADPWGRPENLGARVNSHSQEFASHLSADGSTLYYGSRRPGGYGSVDLWRVSVTPVQE